jgi:hypothetical protein
VDRAVDQIIATMKYWCDEGRTNGKLGALVVCTRYPKIDTKIQRAKNKPAKSFKSPLHIVTKNYEFEFANLLNLLGPHKS